MAWIHYACELKGNRAQILIDDRFRSTAPVTKLPKVAWFGIYCRQSPDGAFWHPDEGPDLDAIEGSLVSLCQEYGNGLAVYVVRIATQGIREYFIYYGEGATLAEVVPRLKNLHIDYRIEHDVIADANWQRYVSLLPK